MRIAMIYLLMFLVAPAWAIAKDNVKSVVINSAAPTIFQLAEPPISYACHPSGVVTTAPLSSGIDRQAYPVIALDNDQSGKAKPAPIPADARLVKVKPLLDSANAVCSFVLTSGAKVVAKIKTSQTQITNPVISFDKKQNGQVSAGDERDLFRLLVLNALPKNFQSTDDADKGLATTSGMFKYEVVSGFSDNQNYKAWIIDAISLSSVVVMPDLKNVKIGELFFSAWSTREKPQTVHGVSRGDVVRLYVLASKAESIKDLMEKLP